MVLMDDSMTARVMSQLTRCEARLVSLMRNVSDEGMLQELDLVVRDLSSVRMDLKRPSTNDVRSSARLPENALVMLRPEQGGDIEAALHDISVGGLLIEGTQEPLAGSVYSVRLPGLENEVQVRAIATDAGMTRMAFVNLDPSEAIALLKHIERDFTRY